MLQVLLGLQAPLVLLVLQVPLALLVSLVLQVPLVQQEQLGHREPAYKF